MQHSWGRLPGGILNTRCRPGYCLFRATDFSVRQLVIEIWKIHILRRNLWDLRQGLQQSDSSKQWQLPSPLLKLCHCKGEYKIHSPVAEGDMAQERVFIRKLPKARIEEGAVLPATFTDGLTIQRKLWGTEQYSSVCLTSKHLPNKPAYTSTL